MSLVHVKGFPELDRFLQELPVKMEKNVLRGAMRAGANVIRLAARAMAPVGPPSSYTQRYGAYEGALRDSIRVTTRARGGEVKASVVAGGETRRGADVFYAHWVEYGTRPHTIRARTARGLFFGGSYVASVEHPGARPRPFMRPALDSQAEAAVVAAAEYIRLRLATKHGLDTAGIEIGTEV